MQEAIPQLPRDLLELQETLAHLSTQYASDVQRAMDQVMKPIWEEALTCFKVEDGTITYDAAASMQMYYPEDPDTGEETETGQMVYLPAGKTVAENPEDMIPLRRYASSAIRLEIERLMIDAGYGDGLKPTLIDACREVIRAALVNLSEQCPDVVFVKPRINIDADGLETLVVRVYAYAGLTKRS